MQILKSIQNLLARFKPLVVPAEPQERVKFFAAMFIEVTIYNAMADNVAVPAFKQVPSEYFKNGMLPVIENRDFKVFINPRLGVLFSPKRNWWYKFVAINPRWELYIDSEPVRVFPEREQHSYSEAHRIGRESKKDFEILYESDNKY